MVPLVYELKVLLDWYCVDTTLWLYDSIKFEDIRQTLFLVGCAIDYYEREDIRNRGSRQVGKFLLGFLSFVGILLVMFTPFLVFSFTSALNGTPVTTISIKLGVVGYPFISNRRTSLQMRLKAIYCKRTKAKILAVLWHVVVP